MERNITPYNLVLSYSKVRQLLRSPINPPHSFRLLSAAGFAEKGRLVETPAFPVHTHAGNLPGALVMVRALIAASIVSLIMAMSANIAYSASCPDGLHMQQFRQQMETLRRELELYRMSGAWLEYKYAMDRWDVLQPKFAFIFLDQEIRNFPLVGNAWCLITAMRTASGQNLNYQPYSDGKFDLLLNGKKIRDRISATELLSIAKSLR